MTRLYTRTGDRGETGLWSGARVAKDHPRIDACGEVDELNSFLGLCLLATEGEADPLHHQLLKLQHRLFEAGADLAAPRPADPHAAGSQALPRIAPEPIRELEAWIDQAQDALPPLRSFILPGGCELAARLHAARSVCRRAERSVTALHRDDPQVASILMFLNRLSDLLFVLARLANHRIGRSDISWPPESSSASQT